jgi:voltage-gated potassium channel
MPDGGSRMRDRFNSFVERHDIAWELGMAFLAVVFVAVGFALDEAGADARPALESMELLLTGVFIAEFALRFSASRDRAGYLRGHWIDLVALAPPARGARPLRLLRLLRLVRAFAGVYRAALHLERIVRYRGFAWLVVAWLSVMVVSSAVLYVAEKGANKAVDSPFDAFWWGVTTLTTVGYGDVVPLTPEGRIAAAVLMLLGIGLFSAITATITGYILESRRDSGPVAGPSLVVELERLAQLRSEGSLTQDEFQRAKAAVLG